MKFWDNIRNHFYQKRLAERLRNNRESRSVINLDSAKSIGLLYDATQPANDAVIISFAENLRQSGKKVEILAFVNDNKTEQKEGIAVFNKKSLSWTLVPESDKAEQFAAHHFDLMLACFTGENLPLEYIARISKARWRVGAYAANKTDDYDMMIKLDDKIELSHFIQQITHYLNEVKV